MAQVITIHAIWTVKMKLSSSRSLTLSSDIVITVSHCRYCQPLSLSSVSVMFVSHYCQSLSLSSVIVIIVFCHYCLSLSLSSVIVIIVSHCHHHRHGNQLKNYFFV